MATTQGEWNEMTQQRFRWSHLLAQRTGDDPAAGGRQTMDGFLREGNVPLMDRISRRGERG